MPSGMCWFTTQPNNKKHNDFISDIYNPAIHRIFIDIADFPLKPVKQSWPLYVENVINNLPDGLRYWENDERQNHVFNGTPGEGSTKDMLIMCKNTGAIPLLCLGHAEERTSWLSRNPVNHLEYLENFCRQLAFYLRFKMGFLQAHIEVFNEPQKSMPDVSHYIKVYKAMAKGFKQFKNFKVHIGSNDIEIDINQYLIPIIKDKPVLADYYATHVLWPRQHNQGYIAKVNELLKGSGLTQSVTEFSPNGNWGKFGIDNDWGAFNELVNNGIEIYCLLFGIRRDFFGDVFDEIRVFTREPRPQIGLMSGDWLPVGFAYNKYIALKNFNRKYYNKKLPLEWETIMLEKYYYRLKATFNRDPNKVGVKFIQSCLGLVTDGDFGLKTDGAVKAYQISKGLNNFGDKDLGIVGPLTFTALIADFPRLYDEMNYRVQIGEW